jgi:hypothetical protein
MSDPSTPCGRATPERAFQPFLVGPARRVGSLQQSSTSFDTPRYTGLVGRGVSHGLKDDRKLPALRVGYP